MLSWLHKAEHLHKDSTDFKKIKNKDPYGKKAEEFSDSEGNKCTAHQLQKYTELTRIVSGAPPIVVENMSERDRTRYECFKYVVGNRDIPPEKVCNSQQMLEQGLISVTTDECRPLLPSMPGSSAASG